MERERKIWDAFRIQHAKKADATDTPIVHAQFWSETLHANDPLLQMDEEDILSELDTSSTLVQWLLNQLKTYDCRRQKIVALIFDKKTVISDVFWVHRELDRHE